MYPAADQIAEPNHTAILQREREREGKERQSREGGKERERERESKGANPLMLTKIQLW
jgi:hypothetical protein